MIDLSRRRFLTGLITAPVVVRSGVLMPLRGILMPPAPLAYFSFRHPFVETTVRELAELIVAVTGWGKAEARERSREAGFDVHLVKPVEEQDLLEVLARRNTPAPGNGTVH